MKMVVLTSGGDSPGMNAAVRAVVRCALDRDWEVVGVEGGYQGLVEGRTRSLDDRSVAGIPATIDNDVWGTDTSLGVDTALNTTLESIDRIKDTASSLRRSHIVEVMGRRCGYLALMAAISGGAEAVLVPEFEPDASARSGDVRVGQGSVRTTARGLLSARVQWWHGESRRRDIEG